MFGKEYMNINLTHMYYFIEVVKCGSLTDAAQRLFTSQSNLSKCIASIEKELNIQLFIRNKKRLHLTEAGQHLYNKWQEALNIIEESVTESHVLQGGQDSSLLIGVLDTHRPEDIITPSVKTFSSMYPSVQIQTEAYPAQELRKKLNEGMLDIIYTVLYDAEQLGAENFHTRIIATCPLTISMLKENPLASFDEVEVEMLKDYDFLCISPQYTLSYTGMIKDLCRQFGFSPNITRYTNSAMSLIYNLKSPKEIFVNDKFYRDTDGRDICQRPLKDTRSGVIAAWRKDNKNPALNNYVNLLLNH